MEMEILKTLSGEFVEMRVIENIAEETIKNIMSKLPEEARTFDVVTYTLKYAKEKLEGMKVDYKE